MTTTTGKRGARRNLALSLGALGVVYGDIGTSPLYALSSSVGASGTAKDDVLGVTSLVFWSLMIVVSIKYLLVVLRADNHGEGGILALFALLPKEIRKARKKSSYSFLVFVVLLGAAFLFADGLLTPAISVVSAVEGLSLINPVFTAWVVPITVVILVVLFAMQSRGTAFMGKLFGPAMVLWFFTLAGFGLAWVIREPAALGALSPTYAIEYIAHHGWGILVIMASVILAVTGVEGLYADLGHFGRVPIRIGWFGLVGIALTLSYLGQSALVLAEPDNYATSFFSQAPEGPLRIYLVAIATIATVIASQALISGVASLASQAIELGLLPRMKVVHTSTTERGQIYVPLINTLIGLGAIILVVTFQSSVALSGAYAFAIAGTMLITTVVMFWVARSYLKWKPWVYIPLLSVFLLFDIAFVTSTSTKLLHGAWLPLVIGFVAASMMWIWRKGRSLLQDHIEQESMHWDEVEEMRTQKGMSITRNTGVYLAAASHIVPQSLEVQMKVLRSIPKKVVVVNVITTGEPYHTDPPEVFLERDWLTFVRIRTGFMETSNIPQALRHPAVAPHVSEQEATYFLTSRKNVNPPRGEMNRAEDLIFATLHRNSGDASDFFRLPQGRVITISADEART
ncbi:MAG TPA: KUP/HAK/KT family potassium transporter [Candidatus Lumbricidophila sp.]|nr:KUP/HAK/KT family potassium transporter [Candidatus Lumbricidophila sp.]